MAVNRAVKNSDVVLVQATKSKIRCPLHAQLYVHGVCKEVINVLMIGDITTSDAVTTIPIPLASALCWGEWRTLVGGAAGNNEKPAPRGA